MNKKRVRSRIRLDTDIQYLVLQYMEQCGVESFSKALCALARIGAAELLQYGAIGWDEEEQA